MNRFHEQAGIRSGVSGTATTSNLFQSFFIGGFECSTHKRRSGRRLDLIAATCHDRLALQDYAALSKIGIRTARDGIRWHLIERTPFSYSFESDLPLIRAARQTGTQVIWDLCHYGWPDDLSPFQPEFGRRLAKLAQAFVRLLEDEGDTAPFLVPINEISFLSWVGGTEGKFPPFATGRGDELKRCLVSAAIECIAAIREVAPHARICTTDPLINVVGNIRNPDDCRHAEEYRRSQYMAWDMIAGQLAPELGGRPEYLDVIGVNYYPHNQWLHAGHGEFVRMIGPSDPGYRPLADMLAELYTRYYRPLFIAETGTEGRRRPAWLRHISNAAEQAIDAGVPLEGICLYPIIDYPGWADDRLCPAGLFGYANRQNHRHTYRPLAKELARQQLRFQKSWTGVELPNGVAEGCCLPRHAPPVSEQSDLESRGSRR